jgi:periplasmic protein CpxP/Spy
MQGRDGTGKGSLWLVAAVLLGLAVSSAAQGPMGPGGPGAPRGPMGPGGLPPILLGVQLTDQQRTQIKAILEESRESRRAEMEERRTLQQQLATAIYGSGTDADSLAALVTRLGELQKQALDADIVLQTKLAALLTDAQREQIVAQAANPGPPQRSR